jgi:NADP-dependent 3-hydroxy acid dehydrogenase YdfG
MGLSQIRSSNGDEVLAIPGDIADRQTADRTIFQDAARFGRIDTLVGRFGLMLLKKSGNALSRFLRKKRS